MAASEPIYINLDDDGEARALVMALDEVCKARGFSFATAPEGHLEVTRSERGCAEAFVDAVVVIHPTVQEITE
jgi:hypothetical protein